MSCVRCHVTLLHVPPHNGHLSTTATFPSSVSKVAIVERFDYYQLEELC